MLTWGFSVGRPILGDSVVFTVLSPSQPCPAAVGNAAVHCEGSPMESAAERAGSPCGAGTSVPKIHTNMG